MAQPYSLDLRQVVADHPDATLANLCEMLSHSISVSTTTLCDFLRHLKITRKKRLSVQPNDIAQMSLKSVKNGGKSKQSSTSKSLFSLMKLGRKRT
jgi:transposase